MDIRNHSFQTALKSKAKASETCYSILINCFLVTAYCQFVPRVIEQMYVQYDHKVFRFYLSSSWLVGNHQRT